MPRWSEIILHSSSTDKLPGAAGGAYLPGYVARVKLDLGKFSCAQIQVRNEIY